VVIRDLRTGTRYSFRAVIPSTPSLGILEGTSLPVAAIPR
jgi:hypothetical protein